MGYYKTIQSERVYFSIATFDVEINYIPRFAFTTSQHNSIKAILRDDIAFDFYRFNTISDERNSRNRQVSKRMIEECLTMLNDFCINLEAEDIPEHIHTIAELEHWQHKVIKEKLYGGG